MCSSLECCLCLVNGIYLHHVPLIITMGANGTEYDKINFEGPHKFNCDNLIISPPPPLSFSLSLSLSLTQVYISQCFGTYQVGFTLIALGVSSAIMSIICSRLLKYIPRFAIMLFGIALSGSMLLFMLFWERVPSYAVIFTIAVGWGTADAVWNTMPTSTLPQATIGSALNVTRAASMYVCMSIVRSMKPCII